jgi:hypothetical protein
MRNLMDAGLPCARQEDIVIGTCYHPSHSVRQFVGIIIGSAERTYVDKLGAALETNVVIAD